MRILVTRPEPDAARTAATLRAAGHQVSVDSLLAVEPVAFDPRLELIAAAGHNVEVSVKHERRDAAVLRADLGGGDGQAPRLGLSRVDVVRLEPASDEFGGAPEPLRGGGVESDQPLRKRKLVHDAEVRCAASGG